MMMVCCSLIQNDHFHTFWYVFEFIFLFFWFSSTSWGAVAENLVLYTYIFFIFIFFFKLDFIIICIYILHRYIIRSRLPSIMTWKRIMKWNEKVKVCRNFAYARTWVYRACSLHPTIPFHSVAFSWAELH